MRVNIYYGGRGLLEDPTLYVVEKLKEVLQELRVEIVRYNLYEDKNAIATLPATLKEADGVILAVSLEWFGIGGLMQQFLDMCWLYGDKNKLSGLYMMPVVMATAYGERDAEMALVKAWEMLGGMPIPGLAAYVENHMQIESNPAYVDMIEKRAEDLYRAVNKKLVPLPGSNHAVSESLSHTKTINLTPQESERLSRFVSDDSYVQKQKADIEELSAKFKQMLGEDLYAKNEKEELPRQTEEFVDEFTSCYFPEKDFSAKYVLVIPERQKRLIIEVSPADVMCYYGEDAEGDVTMKVPLKVLRSIMAGKDTFQGGFMSGVITAKGNFKTLRMMDQIFRFRYKK